MSLRLLTLVWERAPHKDGALLLLLALADFSNDDGVSWPAVETLAFKARMGERHARRLLRDFEGDGIVRTDQRGDRHESNVYVISVEKLESFPRRPKCPPSDGGAPGSETRTSASETRTPVAPQPSGTSKEPPTGEKREDELTIEAGKFVVWFIEELKKTGAAEPKLTPAIRASWADAYEKLVRIDGRSKEEIVRVCRWARRDNFWAKNFLSPVKLRNRNDDQVLYYDVFANRMKSNGNSHAQSNPRRFEQQQSYAGVENV